MSDVLYTVSQRPSVGRPAPAPGQDTTWFERYITDPISDWLINDEIACYGDDIARFHQEIVDKEDTTAEEVNRIFDAVYGVDAYYAPRFDALLAKIQGLADAFNSIAGALDASPPDGLGPYLLRSREEMSARLAEGLGPLMKSVLDAMVGYDSEGGPVYDWDEIQRVLDKDASDITGIEYYALSSLYLQMGVEDMQEFLSLLADKAGEESWNPLVNAHPADYSTWRYDPDKIAGLQAYIDAINGSLIAQYSSLDCSSPKGPDFDKFDELFQLYLERNPGTDILKDDFEQLLADQLNTLEEQIYGYSQRNALLGVLAGLDGFAEPGADIGIASSSFVYPGLNGDPGAKGPKLSLITVDTSEDGYYYEDGYCYEVAYYNSRQVTVSGSKGSSTTTTDNMNANVVRVSPAMTGKDATEQTPKIVDAYLSSLFGYSVGDAAGTALEGVSKIALDKALDRIAEKAESKVIGFIPVIGDVVGIGLDIGSDYAESQQNYQDSQALVGMINDIVAANRFGLNVNFADPGDVKRTAVILSPGPVTAKVLSDFNAVLPEYADLDTEKYPNISWPVTYNDVVEHYDEVRKAVFALPLVIRTDIFGF